MRSLKSIIDSENILILAPPPGSIPVTYTNVQYCQHYERAQANSVVSSSQYMTWTDRQRLIHPPPDFYDGECLFPAPSTASAAADAVPLRTDYVVAACQRMLAVCTQGAILPSLVETTRLPAKKRKASPPVSPQVQTTLRVTGDGVVASRAQRKPQGNESRSTSAPITQTHRAQVITPRYNSLLHWEIDYRKIIGINRNFDGKLLHSYFTTVSEVFLELIAPLRPFQRCFGS
jgi:hypothetical protein